MKTEQEFPHTFHVSDDGFVRLSVKAFDKVELKHFISGLDDPGWTDAAVCGNASRVSGYTEWLAGECPCISLGWDWTLDTRKAHPALRRVGLPRSNIMLTDEVTRDMGVDETDRHLALFIDRLFWAGTVWSSIVRRYG